MPTRSARTTWTGGLQDGKGTVELVSSGIATYEVSFPRRTVRTAKVLTELHVLRRIDFDSLLAQLGEAMVSEMEGMARERVLASRVTAPTIRS